MLNYQRVHHAPDGPPTSLRKHVVGGGRPWEHTDAPGDLHRMSVHEPRITLQNWTEEDLDDWLSHLSVNPSSLDVTSEPRNEFKVPNIIHSAWWFGTWMDYDFPYVGNFIIPTDELIFFRGVGLNHQQDSDHSRCGVTRIFPRCSAFVASYPPVG